MNKRDLGAVILSHIREKASVRVPAGQGNRKKKRILGKLDRKLNVLIYILNIINTIFTIYSHRIIKVGRNL